MVRNSPETGDAKGAGSSGTLAARLIASGRDWRISSYTCRAGPRDRPFEEKHEEVTIAAVVAGSFTYRTDSGRALLYSGAFLLGNAGRCYECGHEHGAGDRCIAFHFSPDLFAEVAKFTAGTRKFAFPAAMLPISRQLTAVIAEAERIELGTPLLAAAEAALQIAENVATALSGFVETPARVSARDERRIADVLHYIEARAGEPLALDALAGLARMSKYHFLRTFRRATGMSPYQFLLSIRMRRAALRLATTRETIASIAFDAGFGDLSTFNHRFRDLFGMSPSSYRRGSQSV